jgi:hypothetical protein
VRAVTGKASRTCKRRSGSTAGTADIILSWYNFACAAARGGHRDEAIDYLRHAIDAGLQPAEHPENDEDLISPRADPRFIPMVEDLQERAHVPAAGQ